jgi:hypothetical protein
MKSMASIEAGVCGEGGLAKRKWWRKSSGGAKHEMAAGGINDDNETVTSKANLGVSVSVAAASGT